MLNIEKENLDNHQVKITVETDIEQFNRAKRKAARFIAQRTKISGFRPGKAPYPVIIRQIGEQQIIDDAIEIHIKEIYPLVIKETSIDPYGPGELNEVVSLDPPKFTFTIPLMPIVELGEYQHLRLPYHNVEITDAEIDNVLDNLRERQAIVEPSENAASLNDIVYIKIFGEQSNVNSDQEPIKVSERSIPILITPKDREDQNEWPYKGFSQLLIGINKGEKKSIAHQFEPDFYVEQFRGVTINYEFIVEDIKSRKLPVLDDEFAQSISDEYLTVESLRKAIIDELRQNKQASYDKEYDEKLLDNVVKISSIDYPPQVLEREKENLLTNFKNRLADQKQDIDLYLKSRNLTMEKFMEEITPYAETRLKRSLVLFELAKAESIQIDQEELQIETSKTMEGIGTIIQQGKFSKRDEQGLMSNVMENVMMDLMTTRTLEKIREIVNKTETKEISEEQKSQTEITQTETKNPVEGTSLVE